ncbi:hypothetical protein NQ317_013265 [Molorchus minor]|uniref:BOS complex subunit NCLN n=1 Tax=Molorchus minor TaxID=1323400 RepID=A0ABQ9JY90_9CUCU|nr:hypothetical protein NQ317_013265 [Molorchus minor]
MWLEEVDELFKGYLPYYFLLVLPIFIIVSPANPVSASSEFPVYRMQQFDLQGVSRGCRSAGINLEARSLTSWSTSRHCVITKLKDLTVDSYQNIKQKAGGLLVMLPDDFPTLNTEDKELLMILENAMLAQEVSIPVYFTHYTKKLDTIIDDVAHNVGGNDMSKSAAETMLNTIAANGYQISISSSTPTVKTDARIANIHGHLAGYSTTGSIPVIGVVAHYDSFGIAPELSYGADSNGSGVVILLELVRIFSGLYADVKTRVVEESSIIKEQKKWLEDQLDNQESSFIQQPSYIMCLDTLAANDSLYMHVSKPPKEGSPAYQFYHELKTVSQDYNVVVDSVHKKINLAHDLLGLGT